MPVNVLKIPSDVPGIEFSWGGSVFHEVISENRENMQKSDQNFSRGWNEADLGYQSVVDMVRFGEYC